MTGEYTIPLAAAENREMWAVLTIDEDKAWTVYFRVRIGEGLSEFQQPTQGGGQALRW